MDMSLELREARRIYRIYIYMYICIHLFIYLFLLQS